MKQFQNILFVSAGPDAGAATLQRVIALADSSGARVTALSVIQEWLPSLTSLFSQAHVTEDEYRSQVAAQRLEELDQLLAPARNAGVDVQTRVRTGKPSIEITRQVLEAGHDLVIKSAEAPRGIHQSLFGSIDLQLLRQCPCPVWVNRSSSPHYRRILAAVDPGPPSLPEPAGESDEPLRMLNEKILQLAIDVAALEESELHVVHAWDTPAESLLRTSLDVEEREIQQLLEAVENEHRSRFDRLLQSYRQSAQIDDTHVVRGPADVVIPELAAQLGVDLIVMGTVCRTGISGFLIGNTAESILNQVETSVLAIKPDEFVSPVRVPA